LPQQHYHRAAHWSESPTAVACTVAVFHAEKHQTKVPILLIRLIGVRKQLSFYQYPGSNSEQLFSLLSDNALAANEFHISLARIISNSPKKLRHGFHNEHDSNYDREFLSDQNKPETMSKHKNQLGELLQAAIFTTLIGFITTIAATPLHAQECLYGDVNLDKVVNMTDLNAWCEYVSNGAQPYMCEADGNYDGVVNLLDLSPFRDILLDEAGGNFQNNTTSGPSDFFWSTRNIGEGAINDDAKLNMEVGESETLYLYYTTNGPSDADINDGFSINVATTTPGIITFDDGGSFSFPIEVSGFAIATRWAYPGSGGYVEDINFQSALSVQDDLVVGISAMSLCMSDGIVEANTNDSIGPFLDAGYDPDADGFLVGKVELTALVGGHVNLIAGPNDLGISNNGQLLNASFASVYVNVAPEILLGDVNLDTVVNLLDVDCFVDRVLNGVYQDEADCNDDDDVDLLDVTPFIQILAGG